MNWLIPKSIYTIWSDFRLEIQHDIKFETGCCYHLKGQNGTGKSSFIKKILIPLLQNQTSEQCILYLEQQVQSQFDAIKAHAALQKPSVHINTVDGMFDYQLKQLSFQLDTEPRPVIIILDETIFSDLINPWLSKTGIESICLVYISHQDFVFSGFTKVKEIAFKPISTQQSKIDI